MTATAFQDRLALLIKLAGGTPELARRSGVATTSINNYRRGATEPKGAVIARLADGGGVRVEWLLTGAEPMLPGALKAEEPHAGYAHIPLLDVRARGGNQGSVVDDEQVLDALAFKEEWIRQELRVHPTDLRLIYVEGNSMEPVLASGDIILIDHTDTTARRESIYVIRMDGALLVKQLQRLPGGVLRVISRNEAYEPFTLKTADVAEGGEIAIIGRVVWACRRF